MKRILFICACVFCVFCVPSRAQEHAIELGTDKKIIHPELLGYNENTVLEDILQVLPELINRTTGSLLANYSVELDGKDVGNAMDVVLQQTRLIEIDCIEVSTSPTASEQTKGQGGTINVKLRNPEQGTHGLAQLAASTRWCVQPAFYLWHKQDKLEIRSAVLLEYDAPTNPFTRECLRKRLPDSPHRTLYLEEEKRHLQGLGETAKLDMKYQINNQNHVRVWVLETGTFGQGKTQVSAESHTAIEGDTIFQFRFGSNNQTSVNRNIRVNALMEYKHLYSAGGEMTVEAGYNFRPDYKLCQNRAAGQYYSDTDVRNQYSVEDNIAHEVTTKIKTKNPMPIANEAHRLDMEVGINLSYSDALSLYSDSVWWQSHFPPMLIETGFSARNLFVSPYLEWEYRWKALTAKAGVRYQYVRKDIDHSMQYEEAMDFINSSLPRQIVPIHDVTANLFVNYVFSPQHRLRVMAARNIMSPTDWQAYTGAIIRWADMTAYNRNHVGNAHTYNFDVDYIFDWEKNGHNLILDCGLRFVHSEDLIVEKKMRLDSVPEIQLVEVSNGGQSNLGMANLSLCYQYHGFSFAFGANTFFSKDRFYYNLSLSPMYEFPRQWYLAGRFSYYSRVMDGQSYLGDCFYAQLRLHKNIRAWTIFLEVDDIFDYMTEDKTIYSENEYMLTQYDLYKRALALGFSYKF